MADMKVGLDPATAKLVKYGTIGLGGLVVAGVGYVVIHKIRKKGKIKLDIKNYKKGTKPDAGININDIVNQLGMDLGYAYPAWDPRRWTENDDEVIKTILKVPKSLMNQVQVAYLKKYTRSLREDLQKLLGSDWNEVKYLFE